MTPPLAPTNERQPNAPQSDYERVAAAIRFIAEHRLDQPNLDDVADAVGLSPYHFQRLFTRWAGVSPKRFLSYLTIEHARALLAADTSILDTALNVGLSGPSRLHDLFIAFEAMTPGEAKNGGAKLDITYSTMSTPFGPAAVLRTARGICGLEFLAPGERAETLARTRWPGANLSPGGDEDALARHLFSTSPADTQDRAPIRLHVKGTNFQVRVWRALLSIAPGHARSYKAVAETVCTARAARAVGGAVAVNPVAVLIPCHRVIRETGLIDGYRWGSARKRALLGWEAIRRDDSHETVASPEILP